jgi:hypothetical protein
MLNAVAPSMNRRQLLGGAAASIVGRVVCGAAASGVVFGSLPSKGVAPAVVFAIVGASLQTLNAILSLNSKGGGLGEQFAALNVKLDQVLRNQLYILQAISVLQQSIDALGRQIGGLFTEERYKSLAIDIFDLQRDTQRFLEATASLAGPLNQTKTAEYSRLLGSFGNLTSKAVNTFRLTNLSEEQAGLKGFNSILTIAPALPVLVGLLDTFRSIDSVLPGLGWEPSEYLASSRSLKEAMVVFRDNRVAEAKGALLGQANQLFKTISELKLWSPLVELFPYSEEASQGATLDICLESPTHLRYQRAGGVPGYFSFRLVNYRVFETIKVSYRAVSLPNASPSQVAYVGMDFHDPKEWTSNVQSIIKEGVATLSPDQFQALQPPGRSSDTIEGKPGCREMLTLIPPAFALADFAQPNKQPIEAAITVLMQTLPIYSNNLIYQEQMAQVGELCSVLSTALNNFDITVGKELATKARGAP